MKMPSILVKAAERVVDRARNGGGTRVALDTPTAPLDPSNTKDGWFGPGRPMPDSAPPGTEARRFDFPQGINQRQQPRANEPVTFADLRMLADSYGLLRLAIETRKDQMARLTWNIVPRDKKAKMKDGDELSTRARLIEDMFLRPDRENFWVDWLRSVLEDLLVIDAPAIHVRRTMDQTEIYSLDQLDGATIKRIVDEGGRTPEPPFAAYQQIIKGMVARSYDSRDLIYRPRNMRVHKLYGYSPVEQILMIINIALRREMWQLSYFTDGNLPDSLIGVPSTWTPDQIRQFQDWFDSVLSGNTTARRGARFVPGEVAKSYTPTKEAELFGGAEEWMARVVCFCFGLSHQALVKEVNRATAGTAKDTALEDGLAPIMMWVKGLIDTILLDQLGETELCFQWVDDKELDPKIASEINNTYLGKATVTINSVRASLGMDPDPSPEADMLGTIGSDGVFVPLDQKLAIARRKEMETAFPPPIPPQIGPDGEPLPPEDEPPGGGNDNGNKEKPGKAPPESADGGAAGAEGEGAEKTVTSPEVRKAVAPADSTPLSVTRRAAVRARKSARRTLEDALEACGAAVATQVAEALERVSRAAGRGDDRGIADALDLSSLDTIISPIGDELEILALDSARVAIAQIGVDRQSDLVDRVNVRAVRLARDRAAELVGRRVLQDGTIIENPNPEWAITESTRSMVRETISRGLDDNLGSDAIIAELEAAYAFSPERADMISRTEIANVNSDAAMETYQEAQAAGVRLKKSWILGQNPCETCQGNADEGPIPLEQDFSSGDDTSPAHPNCECAVIAEVEED